VLQVIRLVTPGRVDSLIAFDALPKRFLVGVKKRDESGTLMLREWLKQQGCVETRVSQVVDPETGDKVKVEYRYPFTYTLEYATVNADKEKWLDIVSYVRRAVDPSFRLLDKIELMARQAAVDSYQEFSLEPADIPVIPVPSEIVKPSISARTLEAPVVERAEEIAEKEEVEILKKKRGRPKKVAEV